MNQKVSRRNFLKLSATLTAGMALAACATPAAPGAATQGDGKEAPEAEAVTLQLMWWPVGGERGVKAMQDVLAPFREAHADITVEELPTPWAELHDKYLTMAAGGAAPDVSAVDNYFLTGFASRNAIMPLDDILAADDNFSLDAYFPAALEEGVWEGQRWSLPYIGSTRVMYYNIDLFEAAGLATPDVLWEAGEWTWDKYLEVADVLTDTSGGPAEAIYGTIADSNLLGPIPPWVWGNQGNLLNEARSQCLLNEPGAVGGIKFCQDLIFTHGVAPTAEATQDVDLVATGRIGVWSSWRGLVMQYRSFDYRWDVVPFPMGEAGKLTLYKGNAMVIAAGTEHTDQAWTLCSYVTGPEADKIYISNGGATPRKDNTETLMNSTPPQNNQYFYAPFEEGWTRLLPFTPLWNEWTTEGNKYLDRVFLNGEDVQTVMDEAVTAINAILTA